MLTIKSCLTLVGQEVMRARMKHAAKNTRHDLAAWVGAIEKQIDDLMAKNPRDRKAVRKELTQIAAAAVLAIAHLDVEGDES